MATGCEYGYERRCEAAAVVLMLTVVALIFLSCCNGSVEAGTGGGGPLVPSLILFGDSTVDVGNNNFVNTLARSDFPPYGRDFDTKTPTGRFTDGRMVADFLGKLCSSASVCSGLVQYRWHQYCWNMCCRANNLSLLQLRHRIETTLSVSCMFPRGLESLINR